MRSVRPIALHHAVEIQTLASDPLIAATTRLPSPYPPGAARLFIETCLEEQARGVTSVFAILEGDRLAGVCGLHNIASGAAEIGYWIGREYWGNGIASFGVASVAGRAFDELRLKLLYASVLETNAASRRVLEKNGFQFARFEMHNSPRWSPEKRLARYELNSSNWRRAPTSSAASG